MAAEHSIREARVDYQKTSWLADHSDTDQGCHFSEYGVSRQVDVTQPDSQPVRDHKARALLTSE